MTKGGVVVLHRFCLETCWEDNFVLLSDEVEFLVTEWKLLNALCKKRGVVLSKGALVKIMSLE